MVDYDSKNKLQIRTLITRNQLTWKKLYTCFIRSQIEFAVSSWSPYTKQDKKHLRKFIIEPQKLPVV
ncbi:hypothetical protein BpHYR1_012807 [Brachionus plicatilis]|uniref:RNA-directed DNA polymerase from mobile element jockey-like n=1 Tax=Brachionus plicatilis TaxID=10195 RepID=A0A3M7RYU8_BRAPC|nr:hypothetical protein BpHYR1_012807 [Brachionus plicatilis]